MQEEEEGEEEEEAEIGSEPETTRVKADTMADISHANRWPESSGATLSSSTSPIPGNGRGLATL